NKLVNCFHHVYRNTNSSRLVSNSASNCLPNPPSSISGKLKASTPVILLHRFHQANVSLLNQIKQGQSTAYVFLSNRHHQPQVSINQFLSSLTITILRRLS